MHTHTPFYILLIALCIISCRNEQEPGHVQQELPAGPRLFEQMPASQTGIDFVQTITEEYRYNFSIDANIFNGGGVAVLDVNNDGLQDLFFTSRLQPCRLYLNKGSFTFEDISEPAGISTFIGVKTGVAVADVNQDGWQDVYVCRTFLTPIPERKNLLFINNRDNTFTENAARYGLDDPSPSQHAIFFDYDLDGDLDCYVLNHPVAYNQINTIDFVPSAARPLAGMQPPRDEYESDKLYRNDGDTFTDVSREAGINNRAWGLSIMSTDFNEDGFPDLYIANDFIMPDFMYINNGDGTFTDRCQEYLSHMSNHTMGIEIADLNNDARPEIIGLDMLGENWERRHRQLTTMQLERYHQLLRQGYGDQQMRNVLQLNLGNGHFSEIGCLAGMYDTEWSWAPLAADFDADGHKDLFITNGVRRDLNDIDFFVYTADSINRTGGISTDRFRTFEDFSRLMPSKKIPNRMFRNTGQLQMEEVTETWGLAAATFSNGAAYVDLDKDGDLDLVVHNVEDPPFVYKNKSVETNGNNWLQISCKGPSGNPQGTGAKISVFRDGRLISFQEMSPIHGFYSSVEPILQVGLGKYEKPDKVVIKWPDGKCQIVEDVNANQRLELNYADAGVCVPVPETDTPPSYFAPKDPPPFVHREDNFEDFNRERLLPRRYSRLGPALAIADVNGDGKDDFFVGGAAGQTGAIFLMNDQGGFQRSAQPVLENDAACEDTGALFFDADGNGTPDLYVVSGGNAWPRNDDRYRDRLYLNDGKGNFSKSDGLPDLKGSGKAIAAFDYDSDGDKDLFVGGRIVPGAFPTRPRSVVLKNDQGRFTDVTQTVAPAFEYAGMVTDIRFADLDGDRKAECVVAAEWAPVYVFSEKAGVFELEQELPTGWWYSLLLHDMDGDGDIDILAGNMGLNHRYHATPEHPMRIYVKDFDNNGSLDPIMAIWENGRYLPVPMRDQLLKQLPHLKKKFVRNATYATAAIEDVFDAEVLQEALVLDAEILASTWFENRDGTYVPHALPDEAQIAPVYGMLTGEFTRDGANDILLAGNDSGFDTETGPIDTSPGCLLRGKGNGVFEPVPPAASGFWALDEARAIGMITDRDRRYKMVLVANNDGKLSIWEGRSKK